MSSHSTPAQTIGPFYGYALPYPGDSELVPPGAASAIRLHGLVLDGDGVAVPDALLEIWQTDTQGTIVREPGSLHRDGRTFTGWGRAATDAAGSYTFTTVRPGPVGDGAGFFALTVFARGLLDRLLTRAYLPDDPAALDREQLLTALPAERRGGLIAETEPGGYRFDIVLQGPGETPFLAYNDVRDPGTTSP